MTNESSCLTKLILLLTAFGDQDMEPKEGRGALAKWQGRAGEQRRLDRGQGVSTETGEHTGSKQRLHKTRDFEKCASMPKTYLLSGTNLGSAGPQAILVFWGPMHMWPIWPFAWKALKYAPLMCSPPSKIYHLCRLGSTIALYRFSTKI